MDSAPQMPAQKKISGRTKAALWLMIAPTALLFASFVLFAVVNWVVGAAGPVETHTSCNSISSGSSLADGLEGASRDEDCSMFGDTTGTSIFRTIANIVLFLTGAVGVITWLPGLIIGIVLLATKPQPTV